MSQDELKQQAAWKAVEYVSSGMVLGLGTGSTAAYAVGDALLYSNHMMGVVTIVPSPVCVR